VVVGKQNPLNKYFNIAWKTKSWWRRRKISGIGENGRKIAKYDETDRVLE